MTRDFVLVHGTTQTPAGFDRLMAELTVCGHRGVAVDLLADGPDHDVAGFAKVVRRQTGAARPVVVAHSGSGVLLPAIGAALGAAHLVWLAAYIPAFGTGRSLRDEAAADVEALFHPEWPGVDPTADLAAADHFLFHDCAPEVRSWAHGTLRLFHPAVLPAHAAGERPDIPSTVIVPAADRTMRSSWMCAAAQERLGVEAHEVPGGHCPHVSHPEAVAAVLRRLA
ncbi:alpha/beta fold hydrolase [Amycolatopsis sp. FDAARGOS 1241]|uniref:alpha/beta fold hydrolase n=1 Tax=Amycolatopsis sp. FDAARGOS 1241 TaxID=2778070 RepID=UPI00194E87F4|nr:alpha/beta hydrolase [Amycolatopsis sp. FDAARGOS 1241]QRP44218.1 alpha/beta hydrolase [Amycolatopsis sp. FDAARGOS 1241]